MAADSSESSATTALKPIWRAVVPKSVRRALYHRRHQGAQRAQEPSHLPPVLAAATSTEPVQHSMTTGPKLSVIIPVYKVEEYLDAAVESVVKQTYQDMEIILVDDGSPDRCGQMCDAWATRDARIRVVHKPNGGLSDARNAGMAVATGDFIGFVDSDDLLDPRAYERLMGALEHSGSDIATGNVLRFQGERKWQGWNQGYSHDLALYPELAPGSRVATGVQIQEHPELMFDTTSWNKVYRRSLLADNGIDFPVGKLYEDMFPVARAYAAASSIDVVFDSVYLYREREDRSSITQKRGELKNLVDKMEMVDRTWDLVADQANSEVLRDTLLFKLLEGDLPVYAPYLGRDPQFDQAYISTLTRYWPHVTPDLMARIPLGRRALVAWQARGEIQMADRAEAWINRHFFDIPIVEDERGIHADLSVNPEMLAPLIEGGYDSMVRYAKPRCTVTEAQIHDGLLTVEGYAFLDILPTGAEQVISFELRSNDGLTVPIEHRRVRNEWANGSWPAGIGDREDCGFIVSEPLATRLPALPEEPGASRTWTMWYSVASRTHASDVEELRPVWRGGAIRLGDTAISDDGWSASIDWSSWTRPLTVDQRRFSFLATSVVERDASLATLIRSVDGSPIREARYIRDHDSTNLPAVLKGGDGGAVEASMSMSRVPGRDVPKGARNGWHLEVKNARGDWERVVPAQGLVRQSGDQAWSVRGDSDGSLCLVDGASSLIVDEITYEDHAWRLTGRCPAEVDPASTVSMWSDKGAFEHCSFDVPSPGRFAVTIRPWKKGWYADREIAWRTGEYHFWLRVDGRDSKYRIRANSSLLQTTLQMNIWDGALHSRFHISADSLDMTMLVDEGLLHTERGRHNRFRLLNQWKTATSVEPMDAAVFASFMEGHAADSPLALFEELKRQNTGLDLYWAVNDGSVIVPDGATPLLKGSAKWFEVLARARYVVNNVGGIEGYGNRPFQRYLQTWHGTPLKHIGRSHIEETPWAYAVGALRGREESSEWDGLVSPNPFFSSIAAREFFYDGPILEIGYPRNDRLVRADDAERSELRSRFGLRADARVLLYAPTFRETGAGGQVSAMQELLDLDRLASELGEEWTIILRGHNYNRRASAKDASRARILDLTEHHDINDLLIVSDTLVTDYSSVMFDYLCTGKPVFNYVPDLEDYTASRGMYMTVGECAVGPLLHEQDALLAELGGIDGYNERYGDRYRQRAEFFVPWDDGHASERALGALMT